MSIKHNETSHIREFNTLKDTCVRGYLRDMLDLKERGACYEALSCPYSKVPRTFTLEYFESKCHYVRSTKLWSMRTLKRERKYFFVISYYFII